MVGLGDLTAAPFTSQSTAISLDGRTIYGFSAAPGVNEQGWVWTEATGMRTLVDFLVNDQGLGEELEGWLLWRISDVSDDGLVLLGRGRNPAGELEDFVVAIPEPASAALLAIGLSLMTAWRLRSNAGRNSRLSLRERDTENRPLTTYSRVVTELRESTHEESLGIANL